jgi:hypothetical protein
MRMWLTLKEKIAGKAKEIAGEILGDGNPAEMAIWLKRASSGMNRRMPSPVRFEGPASLNETKMPVVVSCKFPFHTSERTNEDFGTPGHALDHSCVRACGHMSYRSDSAEVIEPSALLASQLPQRNVTPGDLPA